MKDVAFEYSNEEYGWKSEDIVLTGDIVLLISLKEKGCVVVKKRNAEDAPNPKVYIKKNTDDVELPVTHDTKGKILQVLTSTEPNTIRYANI